MDQQENKYPVLKEARLCFLQKNYNFASELYSEALELMEGKEPIEELCKIYLEYAETLIVEAHEYFTLSLIELTQQRAPNTTEKEEREESLEIAWTLLEVCRNTFTVGKDRQGLIKTHTLLGDILMLNNQFQDAIIEYSSALESDEDIEIIQKIALCYEFLEDIEKYIESNNKIIEILTQRKQMNEIEELQARMKEFLRKMENKEKVPENLDGGEEIIDISKTVRKK